MSVSALAVFAAIRPLDASGVLHSFLAIAAGFAAMAALLTAATMLAGRFIPSLASKDGVLHSAGAIAFNLLASVVFAAIGGAITSALAPQGSLAHALMLAFVVLILGGFSAVQMRQPGRMLYQLALVALPPLAVAGGALLRLRLAGLLR